MKKLALIATTIALILTGSLVFAAEKATSDEAFDNDQQVKSQTLQADNSSDDQNSDDQTNQDENSQSNDDSSY